ncbi:hypothetical protein [Dyadobacter psychrotolerans]|uniref:PepSY domain-containing protein n=1 Tax=Dyadobacter psychrotolerans TaxID=2541721 RepID=A0A4R5DMD5_9BACT|nr:hypothetical protein [Dyadobacter psychrotolerans]TDE15432.1 hypothetical protein E0F88_13040 [Dyadobacter psychrotolerans]
MKNPALLAFSILSLTLTSGILLRKTPDVPTFISQRTEEKRVEVKPDNLPEKVRKSVGYKTEFGWNILKAYLVTNDDKTQLYELYVQKADGETWMKLDKEGKVLN